MHISHTPTSIIIQQNQLRACRERVACMHVLNGQFENMCYRNVCPTSRDKNKKSWKGEEGEEEEGGLE